MDANEFVKEFGWSEAKFYLGTAHVNAAWLSFDMPEHGLKDIVLKVYDLKHLVESHELVEEEGGIDEVKYTFSFASKHGVDELTEYGKRLKQAITDVESCQ